jgi:hypothetical protein
MLLYVRTLGEAVSPLSHLLGHISRRDGRVVYCGCLENSWVNSPGGSNPSPSARGSFALFVLAFLFNLENNVVVLQVS